VIFKRKLQNQWLHVGAWLDKPLITPMILLFFSVLSYGLLINRLGYYWDDFPLTYIYNIFGRIGLENYFSTNRPIWGYLYQITFSLFKHPMEWQLNALIWRWLSAVLLWWILIEVWPKHKYIGMWTGLLFLVYPGFKQQHISVIYSNLFIVFDCFLLSILLNIKALKSYKNKKSKLLVWIFTGFGLGLSLFNLLALEYFFALELLRPIITWTILSVENSGRSDKIKSFFTHWIPYAMLWFAVVIWRVFFFSFQTHNYQLLFLKSLQSNPLQAVFDLVKSIFMSLWVVLVEAWLGIFKLPDVSQLGVRTTIMMVAIIVICLVSCFAVLVLTRYLTSDRRILIGLITVGFFACLLGGIPWWLIELPPTLRFPSDRFTLPFMIGVCLVIVGVLGIIPTRNWVKGLILAVIIAFSVGSQFQVTNQFRRDWETQRRFFWQLSWRIPKLVDGTTLMVNELPMTYYSDNSLTAPLNWFWSPSNHTQNMSFLLVYPSRRLGSSLRSLNPGTAISIDYLATKFNGNTSQTVSIYYEPPACLRVLDNAIDSNNRMLPPEMQSAAVLSSTDWIQTNIDSNQQILPEGLYAPEPEHMWCYYFEAADIARQQDRWDEVASLGDTAYSLNDYPNDPSEHFVFIEGYAHVNNWERARELSDQAMKISPIMKPLLCHLWNRIDATTSENPKKSDTMTVIYAQLSCE
jgi:hypothetical protein